MHRCFIEPQRWVEGHIRPSDSEAHHLRDVLRAEDGDTVAVFDGEGREARAIVRLGVDGVLALEVSEIGSAAERACDIALIQAVPKGARMDLVIEKATELGVARIVPSLPIAVSFALMRSRPASGPTVGTGLPRVHRSNAVRPGCPRSIPYSPTSRPSNA